MSIQLSILRVTLQKNWSFPIRISSAIVTISTGNCGCVTFTEEILNKKLLFLCSVSKYHGSHSLNSCVHFVLIFINSIYHTLLPYFCQNWWTFFLLSAADLGFSFRGCAKWNFEFGKHSELPEGVLGAAPEANAFRAICSLKLA